MYFFQIIICYTCLLANYHSAEKNVPEFLIVISSQPDNFYVQKAIKLKEDLYLQKDQTIIFDVKLLHEDYADISGAWTILPLFKKIIEEYNATKFILFCGDETFVNISTLIENVKHFDFSQELFIGAELFDTQPVIIHHYEFFENVSSFKYPELASGFLLSTKLIARISTLYNKSNVDFSIDPIYELSKFIWNHGIFLMSVDFLCDYESKNLNCATKLLSKFPQCIQKNTNLDKIFFAVKTCSLYHDSRLKVVKETWGQYATRIKYFSDVENKQLNTIDIKVPNTKRGHCAKFMAIMKYSYDEMQQNDFDWLFIADDDTLLSVFLLKDFLSCFNPLENLFIGERYGYKTIEIWGYDYITLGGGMAISKAGLTALIANKHCTCAQPDSPDDMTLGACLRRMNITPVNSPLFHQARPDDYSPRYLGNQVPISFHRHWNLDPYSVYTHWFKKYDENLSSKSSDNIKIEL